MIERLGQAENSGGDVAEKLVAAVMEFKAELQQLDADAWAAWIYNPLEYAWAAHQQYLQRYARGTCQVLFLGMNPGPWGMAQTGVPFGEVAAVRDWLKIDAEIGRPTSEHPKRPVQGWNCGRSEVSGRRLWGLFAQRFTSADDFFQRHFVANYCPLVFMEPSARNLTPDKLPVEARRPLEATCDRHLEQVLRILSPQLAIGVGAFAERCLARVAEQAELTIVTERILHPSPASPAANRDWAGTVTQQLRELGVWT